MWLLLRTNCDEVTGEKVKAAQERVVARGVLPNSRISPGYVRVTNTVESVTVAPALTADGRPSRLWDPRRIDIRFQRQHP